MMMKFFIFIIFCHRRIFAKCFEVSLTKQAAYFLKISIQIRQKICSLAAKAVARAKAMAEAKVEANVFKDLYHDLI